MGDTGFCADYCNSFFASCIYANLQKRLNIAVERKNAFKYNLKI